MLLISNYNLFNSMFLSQLHSIRDLYYVLYFQWYQVKLEDFSPDLCDKFVQFHEDVETKVFLDNCYAKSDWLLTQMYHLLAKSLLSWFMNTTSINGSVNSLILH